MKIRKGMLCVLLMLSLLSASFIGCSRREEPQPGPTEEIIQPEPELPPELPDPTPEELAFLKRDTYIRVANAVNSVILPAVEEYERCFGWDPAIKRDQPALFPQLEESMTELMEQAAGVIGLDPVMEDFDGLLVELLPLLQRLSGTLVNAQVYYQTGEYGTDDFVQGQIYHNSIRNLYTELTDYIPELRQLAKELTAETRAETIRQCLEEELLIEYHLLSVLQAGRGLVDGITTEEADEDSVSGMEDLVAELIQHKMEFDAACTDALQLLREFHLTGHSRFLELTEAVSHVEQEVKLLESGNRDIDGLELALSELAALYNVIL